jgi:nitrogen fixation NifU-like protein
LDGRVRYSPLTIDHYQHPRNLGVLPEATVRGRARDDENLIEIYLQLVGNRVVAARFRALACNACIAAASRLTELVQGLSPREARTLDAKRLSDALGGLPPDKLHCALLASEALADALAGASG